MGFEFRDVWHAISWFNTHNPARQKFPNLLENEVRGHNDNTDITWNVLCTLIGRAIRAIGGVRAKVFKLYCLGDRDSLLHPDDIAKSYNISTRTVHRYIADVRDEIERRLINARAIPAIDDYSMN